MCFWFAVSCCLAATEFLSYIGLLLFPLLGSFYGVDNVYRLSLLLIIHSFLGECIPKTLFRIVPLFNLIVFVILINLPLSLTPWPVIWMYDKMIWLTEPVLMMAEVMLPQNRVMRYSQSAAEEIEKGKDSAIVYKGLVLLFASVCYALVASLSYELYHRAAPSQVLCLFLVACLIVALHNMMLMAHEGIISDCAFCSLVCVTILQVMAIETNQMASPLSEPMLWKQSSQSGNSLVNYVYYILTTSSENAQKSIIILKKFLSPFFLGLLLVRLYSILFIVNKATRNFFKSQDEDTELTEEDVEEELFSPWKSPLLLKISVIFMITQFSCHFLQEWSGATNRMSWYNSSGIELPSTILVSRLAQIVAVSGFYMWRLYRADDWTWNTWLTS